MAFLRVSPWEGRGGWFRSHRQATRPSANTRNVPGVQKIHSNDTMDVDVIQYRSYSTSKEKTIFRF
ncbi:unnamed protein product [Adineta ricciae]|uniref:Uncharacterized protein n=1 Tax=Adineta ricciae TaxID=249248 RepID=A0A815QJB6_ADIRI|nr:unnamed protein product [Adineta ricciae]